MLFVLFLLGIKRCVSRINEVLIKFYYPNGPDADVTVRIMNV